MKQIFRNFIHVVKRFKTSSILNLLGLSAAFAVFIVVMMQVYYDFSFDKGFEKYKDIVILTAYNNEHTKVETAVPSDLEKSISDQFPEIENTALLGWETINKVKQTQASDDSFMDINLQEASDGFFKVFTPKVLEGDVANFTNGYQNIVINKSIASLLFGTESVIGKNISVFNQNTPLTVVAVVEDFPKNSSLNNGIYRRLQYRNNPYAWNYPLYLEVKSENQGKLNNTLKTKNIVNGVLSDKWNEGEVEYKMELISLADTHLHLPEKGEGSMGTTLALLAIGIITLIMAYINFINFSVAMAPARLKSINIQRILGASQWSQRKIIAFESAIFSFASFLIALILISLIGSSPVSDLFSADLGLLSNWILLSILFLCSIFVGFLVGAYPARFVTSFDTIEALKGSNGGIKSSKLRQALIVIQFVAAITLVIIASAIKIQHDYMLNYEWGIDREQVVFFSRQGNKVSPQIFGEDLCKDTRILAYTTSRNYPGTTDMDTWGNTVNGMEVDHKSWPVRDSFLKFFGIEVVAGKDFTELNNPDKCKIIFNQEFVRKYDLNAEDIIGQSVDLFGKEGQIVGIMKDVNFENLKMPIQPLALITMGDRYDNYMFLKLDARDIKGALQHVEETWNKSSNLPIEIQFLDDRLNSLYQVENSQAKLVTVFSIITILIALMGVYGLITFSIKYRAREIAIRKVNGAEGGGIIYLLNRPILIQFVIAFAIAVPTSYFLVNRWLQEFANKANIHWWVFLASGIAILLITVLTVSIQSYRVAIENPVKALKSE